MANSKNDSPYSDPSWMARAFQTEIPFDRVGSLKLIPVMIALMVFLTTLALSSSILVNNWLSVWRLGFHDGFTVELLPVEGNDAESIATDVQYQKRLIEELQTMRGVLTVEMIAKSPMTSLIDPFVQNDTIGLTRGPLSTIIDVTLKEGTAIDLIAIEHHLKQLAPGVLVKDHQQWRDSLSHIAHVCFVITSVIAALMGSAAIMTIGFATHSGLIIHERVIQVLSLIGADHRYIAGQFQTHAFQLALKGSALGLFLSVVAFSGAYGFLAESSFTFFARNVPLGELAVVLAFVPLFLIGIIMVSARITVTLSLNKTV